MLNAFLYWFLPGMVAITYIFWFLNKTDGPVKQVTVSNMVEGIGIALIGTLIGWVAIIMAIGMTWDKFDVGDIVLWKKKKKEKKLLKKKEKDLLIDKVSDADILEDLFIRVKNKPSLKKELMEKLTFVQKPIKGLEE